MGFNLPHQDDVRIEKDWRQAKGDGAIGQKRWRRKCTRRGKQHTA
jgi:hypothetical protein